jgi:bla regulator protein blaR1
MYRLLVALGLIVAPLAGFQNIAISDEAPSKKHIKTTKPVYPPEAKAAGIQGTVQLDVTVAKDGSVKAIGNAAGRPELIQAAADAVKNWIYEPVLRDGQAVEFIATVNMNFNLQNDTATVQMEKSPVEIRGSVQDGKVLNKVRPVYPPDAKAAGLQGAVKLRVVVAENGMLKEIRSVTGPLPLIEPSVQAVRQWTWKPTELDGKPVAVITDIQVNYALAK